MNTELEKEAKQKHLEDAQDDAEYERQMKVIIDTLEGRAMKCYRNARLYLIGLFVITASGLLVFVLTSQATSNNSIEGNYRTILSSFPPK